MFAQWFELCSQRIVELLRGQADRRRFATIAHGRIELIPQGEQYQRGVELEAQQERGALRNGLNRSVLMFPMKFEIEQRGEFIHPSTILITPVIKVGLRGFETED